jgi:hypothetical protein
LAFWFRVRHIIGFKGYSVRVRICIQKLFKRIKRVDLEENASESQIRTGLEAERIANFLGMLNMVALSNFFFFLEFLIEPAILTSDCIHEIIIE